MNNQREIYTALLAGETLSDASNNTARLNGVGELVNRIGRAIPDNFYFPDNWKIYKEPKWYENIPDGGVLCWVADDKSQLDRKSTTRIITNTLTSRDGFRCDSGSWVYAAPLTKQEIQVFMDNAPVKL